MYRQSTRCPRDTSQAHKRKKGSRIKNLLWQAKCWIVVEKWVPSPQVSDSGRQKKPYFSSGFNYILNW